MCATKRRSSDWNRQWCIESDAGAGLVLNIAPDFLDIVRFVENMCMTGRPRRLMNRHGHRQEPNIAGLNQLRHCPVPSGKSKSKAVQKNFDLGVPLLVLLVRRYSFSQEALQVPLSTGVEESNNDVRLHHSGRH